MSIKFDMKTLPVYIRIIIAVLPSVVIAYS